MKNTTAPGGPGRQEWTAWVDEILRQLNWTPTDLAKALGTSSSTISPWRVKGSVPTPNMIRAIVSVPEIAKISNIVDAYLAAGILLPDDLGHGRRKTLKVRTPLSDYSNSEIFAEATDRLAMLNQAQDDDE